MVVSESVKQRGSGEAVGTMCSPVNSGVSTGKHAVYGDGRASGFGLWNSSAQSESTECHASRRTVFDVETQQEKFD